MSIKTRRPVVSSDDGWAYSTVFNNVGSTVTLGITWDWDKGFIRIPDFPVAQGYEVNSAVLTLIANNNSADGGTPKLDIQCNDVDDSVAPTTRNEVYGLDLTTAIVNWYGIPDWTIGTSYDSPDLKTIIQEVVDRPGWVIGNAITIMFSVAEVIGGIRQFRSVDYGSSQEAVLTIDYVAVPVEAGLTEVVGMDDTSAGEIVSGLSDSDAAMGDLVDGEMTKVSAVIHILNRVKHRMENITIANGYNYTVVKVSLGKLTPWEGFDLPAINIWSSGIANTKDKYNTDNRELRLFIELHALTRDENFIIVAEKLACDGVIALNRAKDNPAVSDSPDFDLGERITDLDFFGYDYEIGEGQDPFCGVLLKFGIKYVTEPFDMYNYERD